MSRVDIGAVAEYAFAAQALARGLTPNWPSVETQPYDMICAAPDGLYKVQVKGSQTKGPVIRINVRKKAGGRHTGAYAHTDFDLLAVHLFEYDLWYIIPIDKVKADMRIRPADPACKWHRFKEAWTLLK